MRIGVDLGGTKIEAIVLDDDGAERVRRRIDSPQGSYHATIDAIAGLVSAVAEETDCRKDLGVGIGIPGATSPETGNVKNANSTWLIGHPLDRDLTDALARPVRIANDANCFAVSEATDGAGANYGMVFGIILGTGVGGGIAIDGRTHPASMPSPASGVIIPCPGRRMATASMNMPVRLAIAANKAALKRSYPALLSAVITRRRAARHYPPATSRHAQTRATPWRRRPSIATHIALPARCLR